jgi:hypothetical protein
MKHKWISRLLVFAASVTVGFVAGFVVMDLRVVRASPIGFDLTQKSNLFDRVFVELVRLGEAERVLGSCKDRYDAVSRKTLLNVESGQIAKLRADANSGDFAPPLEVAQAIMMIRNGGAAFQATTSEADEINELLVRSGWPVNSAAELRESLAKMDDSCK